jgi:hypothetical protein
MIQLVTKKDRNDSGGVWRSIKNYDEQFANLNNYKFPGRGQRRSPVAPYSVLLMVLAAIPSSHTVVQFRIRHGDQLRDVFAKRDLLHGQVEVDKEMNKPQKPQNIDYTQTNPSNEKTMLYVRMRLPDQMMTDTTYSKQLTTEILKFGLARSLKSRDDQYNKSIDNGFFTFVYTCDDRYQADIIERIMIYEFSKATVLSSREYVDVGCTALILGCMHTVGSYSSYTKIAEKLFLYMVRRAHDTWPKIVQTYGHSYELLLDKSPVTVCRKVIDEQRVTQMM